MMSEGCDHGQVAELWSDLVSFPLVQVGEDELVLRRRIVRVWIRLYAVSLRNVAPIRADQRIAGKRSRRDAAE